MYHCQLDTNGNQSNSKTEMNKLANYYHPHKETLSFQVSKIYINVNLLRRISFSDAIIVRHYSNEASHDNCFQDNIQYLHAIFKEYLNQNHSKTSLCEQKKCAQRTVFLAQFQPFLGHIKKDGFDDFPTYAVSYQMEMRNDDVDTKLQISFRPITQNSFLINVLGIFSRPIPDEKTRRCVLIESVSNNKDENNNQFIMKTLTTVISKDNQMIDKRLFMVAKNGWLAVFVNNYLNAFLLTENEYLIFPNHLKHLPIFYERIIDMNQAKECSEMFYRRTIVNHDQYSCNGMIVSKGVIQNEFKQNCFTLIGLGNAIINFSFFQELLTISNYKKN